MLQMAFSEISRLDGAKGFFRGAGALMCREVPFYVAGMVRSPLSYIVLLIRSIWTRFARVAPFLCRQPPIAALRLQY